MYSEIDILLFFFLLAPYYIELLIGLCFFINFRSIFLGFTWTKISWVFVPMFLVGSAVQFSVEIMCMWGSNALQASRGQKEALNRRENASKCCL